MNYDAINSKRCAVAGEVGVIFRCSEKARSCVDVECFIFSCSAHLKIFEAV